MRKTLTVLLAAVAITGAACSSKNGSSSGSGGGGSCTAASATPLSGNLTTKDIAFHPTCFSVSSGSTISIQNQDSVTHTFTLTDGSIDVTIAGGTTGQAMAPAAGTYPFHCKIHSKMTGTLIVT